MSDSTLPRKPTMPPGDSGDDIPVEELIRLTREFTRRITNQDRQRLALADAGLLDFGQDGQKRACRHANLPRAAPGMRAPTRR